MHELKAVQLALVAIFGVIVPERVLRKLMEPKKADVPAAEIKRRLMGGEL